MWDANWSRTSVFFGPPPVSLNILLIRHQNNPITNEIIKNNRQVIIFADKFSLIFGNQQANYNINGTINHYGGAVSGHHIAYRQESNQWYRLNDTTITAHVSLPEVSENLFCVFASLESVSPLSDN